MPKIHRLTFETLYAYGLPAHAEASKIELTADDVEALAGAEWRDVRFTIVAERPRSVDYPTMAGGPREFVLGGSSPWDIVHVEARLEGYPAILEWWWRLGGPTLDLLHIEGMPAKEIERLLRARRVVVPKMGKVGRRRGTTVYSEEEFEAAMRHLRANQTGWKRVTQRPIATALNISVTTLQGCLTRAGVTWAQVQRREWPKD